MTSPRRHRKPQAPQGIQPIEYYFNQVERSDDALRRRAETQGSLSASAFRGIALDLVQPRESGYLDLDSHVMMLIANTGMFVEGRRALERLGQGASREMRLPYLKRVIPFNRALRAMIDANPQLNRSEIIELVGRTQLRLSNADDARYATRAGREVLGAMTQELITEEALWQLPSVDTIVEPETEEEELQNELDGIDIDVLLRNGSHFYIDATSSLLGERRKLARRHSKSKSEPFWTGVDTRTFGENVRGTKADVRVARERLLEVFPELGSRK